jgi:hypothetical protein
MQGPIHHIGDPYALEVEDVKSAIDPYFVLNRKYIIHPSVYYMPKACIIRHKICVWAASRCVQSSPNTS